MMGMRRTLAAHGRVSPAMLTAIAEQEFEASKKLAMSMLSQRGGPAK
jgi:hypothetical protein